MKTRNFVLSALGLAAAITFGGAERVSAQGRSQTRIPVRKDQPAEPAPAPKPDTVYIRTRDTVTIRGRTDTVTIRTRPDTIVQMQMLPLQRLPGVYFTLAAGVAVPMNHFRDNVHDGLDLNGGIGWFPANGAIGLRADVNWANFAHRKTDCPGCPDPKLLSGMADLVLRMPLDRTSKINPVIYILGGGGIDKFSDFIPFRNTEGKIVTAGSNTFVGGTAANNPYGVTVASRGTSSTKFDYNVGAGIDYTLGGIHFFNEGRYVTINTDGGPTHYWPILMGLKFY